MLQPVSGSIRALSGRRPLMLDVSNNNPIGGAQLAASGAVALVCKATEGASFVDNTYTAHRELARAHRIPFGGYLFLHPSSSGNEAAFFLEHARPAAGDVQPWIDAEVRDGASFAQVAARVDSCAQVLEAAGYRPLLYSYTSFLQGLLVARPTLRRLRVVQAGYTRVRPRVGHGASVVAWQNTDRLPAAGGHFDGSRLLVPLESLLIGAAR